MISRTGIHANCVRAFAQPNLRLTTKFALQQRFLKTEALNESENLALLNRQRNLRPSSPHFTIYQPQLTWLASIGHRVTGVGLSAGIYAFAIGYVTLPFVGAGFDSQSLIELVQSAPVWFKTLVKAPVAAAFSFHSLNGIRHLLWDTGKFLTLKGAYQSGYAVLGLSAISTIGIRANSSNAVQPMADDNALRVILIPLPAKSERGEF
ncbi:cytochrome b560 subunit of succinate dehydrogenase [Wallemia mellicola]|nr:cytochrome b560 subunit of succinate dehydrogenase [Wallemia mellicola]TIC70995.1 cytochrome b560 subunit of succinate dehydrogenase [Wallemia mellicola]